MLQKFDYDKLDDLSKDRLDKVLGAIESNKIRFPVSVIVKATGFNKGHVSSVLNGKIPMSQNFFQTFMKQVNKVDQQVITATPAETIIALQSAVKILTLEVVQLRHLVTKEGATSVALELEKMMQQEAKRLQGLV
jgi:hypothetical protein